MDRNWLYRSYGYTLERILDVHEIRGDRQTAKQLLHVSFKKAKGIDTLTKLTNEELDAYIQEINAFFPLKHLEDDNSRNTASPDQQS